MRRLGKFVTKEELDHLRTQQDCSGMFMSGGEPWSDPSATVRMLARKYGFNPNITALDLKNGEFVDSKEETTNAND